MSPPTRCSVGHSQAWSAAPHWVSVAAPHCRVPVGPDAQSLVVPFFRWLWGIASLGPLRRDPFPKQPLHRSGSGSKPKSGNTCSHAGRPRHLPPRPWNWVANGGVFHLLLDCWLSAQSRVLSTSAYLPCLGTYCWKYQEKHGQQLELPGFSFLQVYSIPQVGQRSSYGVKSDLKKE